MAQTVTERAEILLNSQKYRIKGPVLGSFADPFPNQLSIGDASFDNRLELSSWVMNDLRGGIGVEEMDEKIDASRCWWTDCIIKYKGHILPPRLAKSVNASTISAGPATASIINGDMELTTGWAGGARSSVQKHGGTYGWLLDLNAASATQSATTWTTAWRSQRFIVVGWFYDATDLSNSKISIYDGVGTTSSSVNTTANSWNIIAVSRKLDAAATMLRIDLEHTTGGESAYFDDVAIYTPAPSDTFKFAHFNGNLYIGSGNTIYKVNATRDGLTEVATVPATITALIPSLSSRLYIGQGDTREYCYMSTGEAIFVSKTSGLNWGFQHDAKLFKVNTAGTVQYSTNPDAASPTWTAAGTITDIAADIQGFVVGRDAGGNQVPYCATKTRIKVYDSATPAWIDTEVILPNHPNGGKGHTYFNGKLYFSYGLAVKEYYPETGSLIDMGLTERDGLPVEYNGEIIKLLGDSGTKEMFALIDSTQVSGNSKSGLYSWNGQGWQCWWADTTNENVVEDIIVSSASSAYAVYWSRAGKVWYIDIPRGIENPDKITQSYATAGIFISPWFDAGNQAIPKLAKVLANFAKGVTTTETVELKYRIDHTNTDLDTGWTTLDTLNTAGESGYNEETFAAGVGLAFKAIQFRLDFVTGGLTAKADIQSLTLYFKKRTGGEKLRRWQVTVLLDDYGPTTAKQKVANLKTAMISVTDVVFSYHPNDDATESYNVSVDGDFSEETGKDYSGTYNLRMVEV